MPCGIISAFNASHVIRRCWFYYCLHVVKAHPLSIVFKTVFTGMATVPHLTSKPCRVCTTTWPSPSTQHRWPATISVLLLPPIHTRPFHLFEEGDTNNTRNFRTRWSTSSDLVFVFLVQWIVHSVTGQQRLTTAVSIPLSNLANDLKFLYWLFISTYINLSRHN